uniref:AAA-ATPase-like domain-containing protein n=1 Tax=Mycena chlorophos TaxID=658473 RepID=A0ABQ0KYD1_MYCCL|nr:predicted protein [Mycena chlorophos]
MLPALATRAPKARALLRCTESVRSEGQNSDDTEYIPDSPTEAVGESISSGTKSSTSAGHQPYAATEHKYSISRTPSPLTSELVLVCGNVFTHGGRVERPPHEDEGFDDFVNGSGVPLVFKRHALEQFARLVGCGYPLLLRRPEGWGLNVFVSMLSAALDEDYNDANDPFDPLLRHQPSSILSERGLHKFFILELDFAKLVRGPDLSSKLLRFVVAHCRALLQRYQLGRDYAPSAESASEVIELLALSLNNRRNTPSLFVIIKNFDSLIYNFTDAPSILNTFLRDLEFACHLETLAGLLLTSTEDNGTIYAPFDERGNPIPSPPGRPYPVVLRSALDLTRHPALQTAVGFTEQDVNDLDDAFKHLPSNGTSLVDMVKAARRSGRSCVFADPAWVDKRLPPIDPSGFSAVNTLPLPDLDCSEGGEGVFPATLVWTVVETKYGFPRRDTFSF